MMNRIFTKMHAVGALALIVASPWVVAMEVLLESELKVSAKHDNNVSLAADNETSLYGEVVNPMAKLFVRTETWSSYINADLRFAEFNREGYGSEDQYLTFSTNKTGERYQFGLQANVTRDTTRTSEELDSGRFSNERRELYSVTPTWTYNLTTRNLLTLQASASTSDYKDPRYASYDYGLAYAEWTYIFNEQLKLFLRANASKYETDGLTRDYRFEGVLYTLVFPGPTFQGESTSEIVEQTHFTDTETNGFQIGASYQWTEKLSLFGLFGSSDTDTDYEVITENNQCESLNPQWFVSDRGVCGLTDGNSSTKNIDASLMWEEERQSFSLGYSISSQPSSDGYLLEFKRINLNWSYEFFERGTFSLATIWGQNEALDQPQGQTDVGRSNREFITTTAAYNHRLTEKWYINISLQYRYQEREILASEAEGLGGTIGISYFFDKKQW